MHCIASVFVVFAIAVAIVRGQTSTACPDYDASKIKLVTFDCFAALMNWEASMTANVAAALPSLSSSEVGTLVDKWRSAYGNSLGTRYEEYVTGSFPFSYFAATSLQTIVEDMNLTVSRSEFHELVLSWSRLQPWHNTQETLEQLHAANLTIGVLSNGDRYTLTNAVSIFSTVPFTYVFPSDFPAGVFKPQHDIYDQTRTVGFDVEEILHVAGGPQDGGGARDAGLFSVVTYSTSRRRMESVQNDYTEPCFSVNDISEVPALLGL